MLNHFQQNFQIKTRRNYRYLFFISFMVIVKMDVELFKHVSLSRGSLHALGHVQHSCIFVIERKVRKKLEEAIVHVNGFHVNFWKVLFV